MKKSDKEFKKIIKDLVTNKKVLEMKKYRQHFDVSCFEHCYEASYICYKICKKLNWDYVSLVRAAMLHDMFLYDWRSKDNREINHWHAFYHGKISCKNALKEFDLSQKEQDIIKHHMWPVTLKFPTSKEGFLLTFVDKYCALKEITSFFVSQKRWKYSYLVYIFLMCLH